MKKNYLLLSSLIVMSSSSLLAQYCTPPSYLDGPWTAISNVTCNGINHDTGNSEGYADYSSSEVATVAQGESVNFDFEHYYDPSLVSSFDGAVELRVWIDWNQDEDFDDAGETVISTQVDYGGSAYTTSAHSFSVPSGAALGSTRMRVYEDMLVVDGHAVPDPCGYSSGLGQHGECHDYGVTVTTSGAIVTNDGLISDLTVFPNPASDFLTVKFLMSKPETVSMSLHNLVGEQILFSSEKLNGAIVKNYDISTLPQGIYFLNIQSSEGRMTKKIVVK
jgi:hypothetical protein